MICKICKHELEKELVLTQQNSIEESYYAIVIRNLNIGICRDCFIKWNKVLEFLVIRFTEQGEIDDAICKKILSFEQSKKEKDDANDD